METKDINTQLDVIENGVNKSLEMRTELDAVKKELETMKSINIITGDKKVEDKVMNKSKFWNDVKNKSVNEYTAAQGGYAVPEEWYNELISLSNVTGKIRPISRVIPMTTDTMNIQGIDAMTVGYIAGSAAVGEKNINLTPYVLSLKKIGAAIRFDNDFLADVTPAKVRFIEEEMLKGFGSWEDKAFLQGNGVADATNGGISGVLVASGVTEVTGTSAFSGITADNLSDLMDAPTTIGSQGRFVIDRALKTYIRKLKHNSQYIYSPAGPGDVETVWGMPVIWTNGSMPSVSATGTAYALFGYFEEGLLLGDRGSLTVDMDSSVGFLTNQTVLRAIRRLDAIVIPSYFSRLVTA